jgi:hypothetical protein
MGPPVSAPIPARFAVRFGGGWMVGQGFGSMGDGLLPPWIVRRRCPLDFLKRAGWRT